MRRVTDHGSATPPRAARPFERPGRRGYVTFAGLALVAVLLTVGSCEFLRNIPTGEIEIIFDVDPEDPNAPNEVIFADSETEFAPIERQALLPGTNTVRVPRGGTYVIGLVRNAAGSRSISSVISTIGNIGVVAGGLDSLPTGEETLDTVDLGPVTLTDGTYESGISAGAIATGLGEDVDILAEFGETDQLMMKALNPDINRNGVYDADEGIEWEFICTYNFYLDLTSEDFAAGSIPAAPLDIRHDVKWTVRHTGGIPSHMGEFGYEGTNLNDDIRLYYPPDMQITSHAGDRLTYRASYFTQEGMFDFDSDYNGMHPRPPYDGDYRLEVYGDSHYFQNVQFLKPADDYQHLLLIIYTQVYDAAGTVTSFAWKWKEVVDGAYVDPNPEVVRLRMSHLHASWERAGGGFNPDYDDQDQVNHTEEIGEYWLNGSATPSATVNAFDMMFTFDSMDAAGNGYFYAQENGFVPAP